MQQDADLIPDSVEKEFVLKNGYRNPIDTDNDGTPDWQDLDSDNDGLPDALERGTGPGPSNNPIDTDNDGTPDFQDKDSDGDGIWDDIEAFDCAYVDNHVVTSSDMHLVYDQTRYDNENFKNNFYVRKRAPAERCFAIALNNANCYRDGLVGITFQGYSSANRDFKCWCATTGTDYASKDISQSYSEGDKGNFHCRGSALVPVDSDGDNTPDYLDLDSDNDGLPDSFELTGDADSDGTPDYQDPDDDNDGIATSLEM